MPALSLAGQLGLHLLYGRETFLYAAAFGPLLVLTAAMGSRPRARPVALVLAALLVISAGANNLTQLAKAVEFVDDERRRWPPSSPRPPEAIGIDRPAQIAGSRGEGARARPGGPLRPPLMTRPGPA